MHIITYTVKLYTSWFYSPALEQKEPLRSTKGTKSSYHSFDTEKRQTSVYDSHFDQVTTGSSSYTV